jgi:hypothetical protein
MASHFIVDVSALRLKTGMIGFLFVAGDFRRGLFARQ